MHDHIALFIIVSTSLAELNPTHFGLSFCTCDEQIYVAINIPVNCILSLRKSTKYTNYHA